MSLRYSIDLRNAALDARIKAVGPKPLLKIHSDSAEIASIQLPDGWMPPAEDGVLAGKGGWFGYATSSGKARSFRICDALGEMKIEGAIPDDMRIDNPDIVEGQMVTVDSFTIRSGNG